MLDRLVDLVDRFLEVRVCQIIVSSEVVLKFQEVLFKVGNIDILVFYDRQFLLILKRILRGIAKKCDDRDEALRTYHIHLLIAIGNIDDTGIIKLAVALKK